MKKLRLGLFILLIVFSLVGCNSKIIFEEEAVQKKLDEANTKIESLEEKIEELSNKLEENKTDNFIIEPYSLGVGSEKNTSVEITVNYLLSINEYNKTMEKYKEKFADEEGKKVIYPNEVYGDRIFILRTNEKIKNITLSNFSSEYSNEFNYDTEKYFEQNGIKTDGNILKELNPDEILIFTANESEGIPSDYFCWIETDGRIIYNPVLYDGKGELYTYE